MKLTILGSSAAYPGPGQACSGYLIESSKAKFLIDLGTGSLANLFKWVDPSDLDALIISHLHHDHFLDIYPLRYHYEFDGSKPDFRLKTLAPKGALNLITSIISEDAKAKMADTFDFTDISDGSMVDILGLKLSFNLTRHNQEAYAVTVQNEKKLVYTADTGIYEGLTEIAKGADLLLAEATLQDAHLGLSNDHLTARQAGALAKEAGAKRLALTHIWPTYDRTVSLAQAKASGYDEVEIAKENAVFEI